MENAKQKLEAALRREYRKLAALSAKLSEEEFEEQVGGLSVAGTYDDNDMTYVDPDDFTLYYDNDTGASWASGANEVKRLIDQGEDAFVKDADWFAVDPYLGNAFIADLEDRKAEVGRYRDNEVEKVWIGVDADGYARIEPEPGEGLQAFSVVEHMNFRAFCVHVAQALGQC